MSDSYVWAIEMSVSPTHATWYNPISNPTTNDDAMPIFNYALTEDTSRTIFALGGKQAHTLYESLPACPSSRKLWQVIVTLVFDLGEKVNMFCDQRDQVYSNLARNWFWLSLFEIFIFLPIFDLRRASRPEVIRKNVTSEHCSPWWILSSSFCLESIRRILTEILR